MSGVKDVENRTWTTTHRGPLLIHAAVKLRHDLAETSARHLGDVGALGFPRGFVLGLVDLLDVVEHDPSPWAVQGHRHWKVRPLLALPTPVPASGSQSLWRLTGEPLNRVQAMLAR